ncbi:hypothetical protein GIB67_031537 [Kingdonia uniflora]|uniref:RING-type E3 ubiquitin transferase n=1 Tax=Kingdonia uniflora TaxID=39325 RepID=A0A7J7PBC8_9MAGN|nr:hypothetical protein GIB67_031537 [Kingdonia uniflora]
MSDGVPREYASEKSYALSGKIMLSAIVVLFVVVIIIVCLHIYARWYLIRARRRLLEHRRAHNNNNIQVVVFNNNGVAAISNGLEATVLKSIPTFTYSITNNNNNNEREMLECAVCLSEFEVHDKGRVLPKCSHSFHTECIDMWFHSHSTCPIRRADVVSPSVPQPVTETEPPTTGPSPGSTQVEILVDSAESQPGPSSGSSSSESGRRKAVLELVVIPRRTESFRGLNLEGNQISPGPGSCGYKSPGGRIRSFRRMLSISRALSPPASAFSCCSSSVPVEVDLERGEREQDVGQVQR